MVRSTRTVRNASGSKDVTGKSEARASSTKASSDDHVKPSTSSLASCWLMKAEPDPRLEKGIDISFSVDKFAEMPDAITQWDGVRNPEARTMMREKMKIGDKVLFYHSNCKLPGIAGLAKVVKEGYPDYTAWDAKHPYFDPKTDKENPKWFMVDVQLERKLPNLVPLALLQLLRDDSSKKLDYLTKAHRNAISSMQLLNRGRLSVQYVEPDAYDAIILLADQGGWQEWPGKWQVKASKKEVKEQDEKKAVNENEESKKRGTSDANESESTQKRSRTSRRK
ncbi:DUF55-domain-containing protein [Meira miltonrushii]|uniref:DUF55-domain-containing protein n=1 Tax=Meira miltonrushii TaxID=1280837 RepID=A0A316VBX7_9BASI|nr:DUF55-domain-containing protein [Meira miltonrushii]PWN35167.1 DUF55-domain-containing protein [Meira miltonrushii]